MMTPTITRRQKDTVSSLVNRLRYSLKGHEAGIRRLNVKRKSWKLRKLLTAFPA